jgi:hypothetical protein
MSVKHQFPKGHIDEAFRIDVSPFINRPFFVQEVIWASTDAKYKLLNNSLYKMPRDVILSNNTLLNGMKIGSLYRLNGKLNISVAGTISHGGCILAGIIPPLDIDIDYSLYQYRLINTILSGPHGFLHANEATSIVLDIPWYCNTDYDTLDVDTTVGYSAAVSLNGKPANCGTLVFLVLNPLQPSTGSSTSLSIIVECVFSNLEVMVPTPRYVTYTPQSYFKSVGTEFFDSAAKFAKKVTGDGIDALRGVVKSYTGLHNPNIPQIGTSSFVTPRNRLNNVDVAQYMENLDPNAYCDRIVEEPVFNTVLDEMNVSHICGKKQFIGTFKVNVGDPVGKLLFARPITPDQGGLQAAIGAGLSMDNMFANNIELLHYYSRAWRGSIKITLQSVMNNKQQVKLRLVQMYNPSADIAFQTPVYRTVLQAPSHLMEFSGGGQEHEIVLPYASRNKLMYCSKYQLVEAKLHGMYYIYVA